jgi:hypothetical protein
VVGIKVLSEKFPGDTGNDRGIFTEPLPSNDTGIHIQTHRLMGGTL